MRMTSMELGTHEGNECFTRFVQLVARGYRVRHMFDLETIVDKLMVETKSGKTSYVLCVPSGAILQKWVRN